MRLLVALLLAGCSESGTGVLIAVGGTAAIDQIAITAHFDGRSLDRLAPAAPSAPLTLPLTMLASLPDEDVSVSFTLVGLSAGAPVAMGGAGPLVVGAHTIGHASVTLQGALDGGGLDSGTLDGGALDGGTGEIAWRATASVTVDSESSTMIAIARPTALDGDVLVAAISFGSSAASSPPPLTPPAGWTLVRRVDHANDLALVIYWKAAAIADPATFTWTTNLNIGGVAWISSFAGVDLAAPVDADAGQDAPAAGNMYATPSIVTSSAGDRLVTAFVGHDAGNHNVWTAPGPTLRVNASNPLGSRSGAAYDLAQLAPGATGPFGATASSSQQAVLTHVLALRRAP